MCIMLRRSARHFALLIQNCSKILIVSAQSYIYDSNVFVVIKIKYFFIIFKEISFFDGVLIKVTLLDQRAVRVQIRNT